MGPDLFRRRIEDDRLIRGLGRFTGDIPIAGALQMVVVRSHFAHARVLSVDLAPALEMPTQVSQIWQRSNGSGMATPPLPLMVPP